MKTKNKYIYPVKITDVVRISYDESPAHVGNLKSSVDFICKEETKIRAAADGIVVDLKSDSNAGGQNKELEPFGNFIELQHDNEEYSEYEHLKKDGILVKLGDQVRKGQIIGYSGSTGWLAHLGPHLHFMVGKYGESDNDYEAMEVVWDIQ
ncbi:hypothetical protein A3H10_01270 [Candidatus Uhrbacteria bacterium RIFCSPLOWO2_12_FULL_46_10]|uniref:M23ase beta-sheet core domain-containing protein n=1 Tax=Candidatus Uhrbacteria bacterium RIFCSPLOWO2_01_FULL_47_25 TaxID=1802402 RepID=A0A1F7UPL5_9BACT|nr:MAG: Peptidase M23 [Parcubacteria group bacterium GW2011_GWA2_46_9]OGL59219.1 MAG: hypothetical protein A2752_01940 [Candidatus Uhrbacteria bacterium RIFCSPHIGHO2_01_FULL_46_23]OGL69149.1 MAG: hypothetical protein A3D60_04585 [Candidatus Uhrbacteria bacterium RIFCSPHIGHO2_02_FULL_47_29]OGL75570.1 MAG: hypothetical protein A3E96_03045 [Candidatus Uhrbacteria bacterium RIFCSPHIGHO2_12_FULL_46_13]OGL80212.1 MAG: hypothetical protein A2936_02490 [Candidatus Uhrbacteria bacterium RIFCSPLOWO2_01_F